MKTHIVRRREGETLSDYVMRWLETERGIRETEKLIEEARAVRMTPEEAEAQRRSFAYGNVKLSNPAVTREMVDEAASDLACRELPCGCAQEPHNPSCMARRREVDLDRRYQRDQMDRANARVDVYNEEHD